MKHPKFTWDDYPDPALRAKAEAEYYKKLVTQYEEILGDPLGDIYGIVTQQDTDDLLKSRGAIMLESYTGQADLIKTVEKAEHIGNRYGKIIICKLIPVGGVELCKKIINSEF